MAPFKIRFSKMGKSRSGDSGCSAGNSHNSSHNSSLEVDDLNPQDQMTQHYHQHHHHRHSQHPHQLGSSESVESYNGDCVQTMNPDVSSCISVNTASTVPESSPPPSYERVLEEVRELRTRLQRSMAEDEEAIEESNEDSIAEEVKKRNKKKQQPKKNPEKNYKSSKEYYRAMAKQWGITCKMSDNCRCLDCQARYFDCDYPEKYTNGDSETQYHEQSDGGLSASTPMFVSEMMHGSACQLL